MGVGAAAARYEDTTISYPPGVTQAELAAETQKGVHVIDGIDVGDVVQVSSPRWCGCALIPHRKPPQWTMLRG